MRTPLVAVSAVLAGVFGLTAPAAAAGTAVDPSPATAGAVAQIRGADGSIDFVPVKGRTVADAMRTADAMPGSLGHAFDQPVAVGAMSNDPLRFLEWDLDTLHIDDVRPFLPALTGQLVAVVDTGVDPAMPDWNAGQVRCDLGTDLVGDAWTTSSDGDGCVDPHGHGTHVAGTIGAVADNGIGVAGVASGVQILPVRVMNPQGTGLSSTTSQGIVWAVDHGATVVNLSLGGGWSEAYDTAVRYATDHGVTVVASAGNNAQEGNATRWPCASPGAICVTATDRKNAIASFSNYSGRATVAAPGVGIWSLDARRDNPDSPYTVMSGTSMASPHVAGAAALFRATHSGTTPGEVTSALTTTATDLGAPGWDPYFGAGLVNPYRLVTGNDLPSTPDAPQRMTAAPGVGSVKLSWSTVSGIDGYRLYRDDALLATLEPALTAYKVKAAAGTAHKYAVRAFGAGGQSAATFVFATAKYPAGTLTVSAAAGKITIRGANLRPGSVVTARLKTATLGAGRVGAGGTVTVSAKRKAGTVTVTGVDRNGNAVKVSKSITAR